MNESIMNTKAEKYFEGNITSKSILNYYYVLS